METDRQSHLITHEDRYLHAESTRDAKTHKLADLTGKLQSLETTFTEKEVELQIGLTRCAE